MENTILGSYIIIERDYTSHPGAAAKYWHVKCQYCGQEKIVRNDSLKKYPVCKCQRDKMINKTFGDFYVIAPIKERAKDKCIQYQCSCIHCGNVETVASNVLRSERKHCSKCHIRKSTLIDMTGQIYGFLRVLYRDVSKEHTGHENDAYWVCQCLKCGSVKPIRGISLRNGTTVSCGCIKSKGEEKIANLLTIHKINFKREYIFTDLYNHKFNCKLRFDFAIFTHEGKLSHLIEYDGEQHFEEMIRDSGWNTYQNFLKVKENDELKNLYCLKNNIPLIRIKFNEEITIEKLLEKGEVSLCI